MADKPISSVCMQLAEGIARKTMGESNRAATVAQELLAEMRSLTEARRENNGEPITPDELISTVEKNFKIQMAALAIGKRNLVRNSDVSKVNADFMEAARAQGVGWDEMVGIIARGGQGDSFGIRAGAHQTEEALMAIFLDAIGQAMRDTNNALEVDLGGRLRDQAKGVSPAARKRIQARRDEVQYNALKEVMELERGEDGNPGSTNDPNAIALAERIFSAKQFIMAEYRRAGGLAGEVEDHGSRQTHDAEKIQARPDDWLNFMLDNLDWNRTADGRAHSTADRVEFLKAVRNNIAGSGKSPTEAKLVPEKLRNTALASRVLHFADGDARVEYHKEFGKGSVMDVWRNDFLYLARETAKMKHFGTDAATDPKRALNRIFDEGRKIIERETSDLAERERRIKQLKRGSVVSGGIRKGERGIFAKRASVDQVERYLDGTMHSSYVTPWGKFWKVQKNILSGSLLGMTPILAMTGDQALVRNMQDRVGGSLPEVANTMKELVGSGPEWKARAAGITAYYGAQPEFINRYTGDRWDGQALGTIDALGSLPHMLTGLTQATERNRVGAYIGLQKFYSRLSEDGKTWDQLGDRTRQALERHGFKPDMWHVLKETLMEDFDGDKIIDPQHFDLISNESILAAYPDRHAELKNRRKRWEPEELKTRERMLAADLRRDLRLKFDGMVRDQMNSSVLVSDDWIRDAITGGSISGSGRAEFTMAMAQFSTWSLQSIDRAIMPAARGRNWKSDSARLLTYAASLGVASAVIQDLVQGKDPVEEFQKNPAYYTVRSLDRGGAFPLIGGFLRQSVGDHAYYADIWGDTLGPTFGNIQLAGEVATHLSQGEYDKSWEKAQKLGGNYLPLQNHWLKKMYDAYVADYIMEMAE